MDHHRTARRPPTSRPRHARHADAQVRFLPRPLEDVGANHTIQTRDPEAVPGAPRPHHHPRYLDLGSAVVPEGILRSVYSAYAAALSGAVIGAGGAARGAAAGAVASAVPAGVAGFRAGGAWVGAGGGAVNDLEPTAASCCLSPCTDSGGIHPGRRVARERFAGAHGAVGAGPMAQISGALAKRTFLAPQVPVQVAGAGAAGLRPAGPPSPGGGIQFPVLPLPPVAGRVAARGLVRPVDAAGFGGFCCCILPGVAGKAGRFVRHQGCAA
mmetsp:Transcript_33381/g.86696  ORF Transcript_33381/g.86696 Transcript_33381/m.86696 type:complete len:269 (-) Transcript_33381:375-1181(-)